MGLRGGEAGRLLGGKIHGESERTSRLGNLSCLCSVLGLCLEGLLLASVMLHRGDYWSDPVCLFF